MKKTTWIPVAIIVAIALALSSIAVAQTAGTDAKVKAQTEKVAKNVKKVVHQTMCPVMGNAIDKKLFVDFEGKRIYVCCAGCLETVKKDPAKYIKDMEAQGITLFKAPAKGSNKGGNSLKDKVKEQNKKK